MAFRDNDIAIRIAKFVRWKVTKYEIVLFTKSYSAEGQMCHDWIQSCRGVTEDNYACVYYERRIDSSQMDDYFWTVSGQNNRDGPHIFVRGDYLGGYKKLMALKQSGKLQRIINNLPNFPPGAGNYSEDNKSWNLAHEADPDVLPDMVLKFGGSEDQIISIKVRSWEGPVKNVDCEHFGPKNDSAEQTCSADDDSGDGESTATVATWTRGASTQKSTSFANLANRVTSKSSMYLRQTAGPDMYEALKLSTKSNVNQATLSNTNIAASPRPSKTDNLAIK